MVITESFFIVKPINFKLIKEFNSFLSKTATFLLVIASGLWINDVSKADLKLHRLKKKKKRNIH